MPASVTGRPWFDSRSGHAKDQTMEPIAAQLASKHPAVLGLSRDVFRSGFLLEVPSSSQYLACKKITHLYPHRKEQPVSSGANGSLISLILHTMPIDG